MYGSAQDKKLLQQSFVNHLH